jgi:hypothetical protein
MGLSVYPLIGASLPLGEHVSAATNTFDIRVVRRVTVSSVRVLSEESLWACLCIPLLALAYRSVKTFPRQRIHAT